MQLWMKVVWIVAILVNLSGVIWFVLGSTASFQRNMDLVSTVILVYLGVPSIILIVFSSVLLFKKWRASKWWEVIGVLLIMIAMLLMTPHLYKNVETSGWLTERVKSDGLQVTSDHKYEYNMELVNTFQKNSSARLRLKNMETSEEMRIPLNVSTKGVGAIFWEKAFGKLEVTNDRNIYLLYTTAASPFPGLQFEVNIQKGTAVKID